MQRPPDFTGERINRFSSVFVRHGLPVAVVSALILLLPELRSLLWEGLAHGFAHYPQYLAGGAAMLAAMVAYVWLLDRRVDAASVGWMLYLLGVSVWEEWLFRLAIPYYGASLGMSLIALVLVSNLAFGVLHYFTLRWRWQWCLIAFVGGLALSRQMHEHFNLSLLIAYHWAGTFLNTPRPPGRSSRRATTQNA